MIVTDVVCGFCGSLCDHIEVRIENGEIEEVKGACPIGSKRFLHVKENRILKPLIRKNGEYVEVSLDEAIDKAVEILNNSDLPLIYGLSSTSIEAQKVCVDIAELIGGILDQTACVCHGPTIQALQEVGEITATLGEIKNRADLVIFWGCNPMEAHFNHPFRYSVMPAGLFRKGRKERTIITLDIRKTRTAEMSDKFIQIEPERDHEVLLALRMILKGRKPDKKVIGGVPIEIIEELADKIKSCQYGVVFVGVGLTMTGGRELTVINLLKLSQEVHDYTRLVVIPMRGHGNVKGAGSCLAWRTGYPYAVDFSRGYPRYFPGEATSIDLLSREEVDAALIVASDPASNFPLKAAKTLAKIPTIAIDIKPTLTTMIAEVVIPAAVCGVECEGTMYRMDGVPIRLKKLIDSPNPEILPDEEILRKIYERLGGR